MINKLLYTQMAFYLILPSDGCQELHKENTPNHFKITLNQSIYLPLEEKWEIALVELTYVNAIQIFNNKETLWIRSWVMGEKPSGVTSAFKPDADGLFPVEEVQWTATTTTDTTGTISRFRIEYNKKIKRFTYTSYMDDPYIRVRLPVSYLAQMGFIKFGEWWQWEHLALIVDSNKADKTVRAPYPPRRTFIRLNTSHPLQGKIFERVPVPKLESITPQPGYYATIKDILKPLNVMLTNYKAEILFQTNDNRIRLNLSPNDSIKLENGMRNVLGFTQEWYDHSATAENAPSLRASVYSMYIYCNIIEDQRVGHQKVPLLRSVPVLPANPGHPITVTIENKQYHPLNTSLIDMIEISIHNDSGGQISFDEGKTLLLLHFRPSPQV